MAVDTAKAELRRRMRLQRKQLTKEQAAASSLLAARHILACDAYRRARCIMGYLAFGRELSVDFVLRQALADGKLVAVPQIISATEMNAVRLFNMDDFAIDRFGIRSAPEPAEIVFPQDIDLLLVPGVAFGRDGSRLGMGAGYYDRFLPKARQAVLLGVAYEALLQEQLPCGEHDVYMQLLASEKGVVAVNSTQPIY